MTFAALVTLAVGLAMDASAVAAARGLAAPQILPGHVLRVALIFGGFQAGMPFLGWHVGSRLGPAAASFDHWIAFVLLSGIGAKMLHEARGAHVEEAAPASRDLFGIRVLLLLGIATSVDAFAAGITLPILGAPLVPSLVVIGVTTALLSVGGLYAGRRFGAALGRRLDALGGIVLIGLGVRILVEHLVAG